MKRRKKKTEESYSQDKVAVILEDIQDQFSAFGDGQKFLTEKVDNLEIKVDRIQEDVLDIKHNLSEKVDREDLQKLEKKVFRLEKMVLSKT